uniref:Uncharacterized protein n=1 Tax=Sus scrofa TaxID=9823 RepID=A0A4X1UQH3_PIG
MGSILKFGLGSLMSHYSNKLTSFSNKPSSTQRKGQLSNLSVATGNAGTERTDQIKTSFLHSLSQNGHTIVYKAFPVAPGKI